MENDSSPQPAPPAHVSVFSALRRMALTLVFLAALWVAYVYAVPRFLLPKAAPVNETALPPSMTEPGPSATPPDPAIARMEMLEAKLKAFEDVITALPKEDPASQAMNEKIGTLETRIDTLQQQNHTGAVDSERLARLEAQLDELQSTLASFKDQLAQAQERFDRQVTVRTAFRQLKETIERGEPFFTPLAHMRLLAEPYPQASALLDQLSSQAATGIPTLAMLQGQFEKALPLALAPNTDSLGGKLQSLVLVRKVGEQQPGNNVQSIIARAEAKLARGDIEGCVGELAHLPKPSARSMSAWVQQARNVLAVRQQLDALELTFENSTPPQPALPPNSDDKAPAEPSTEQQPAAQEP